MRGDDIRHVLQPHIRASARPHTTYTRPQCRMRHPVPHAPQPFATLTESPPMLVTILLVILILALIGGLPHWGYSRSWGYGPSGGLGLIVIILVVLLLMGRI
jgi:hypothetical protein